MSKKRSEAGCGLPWPAVVFLLTLVLAASISFLSDQLMSAAGIAAAFLTLTAIVILGIIFDIIGVAVTSADEEPFHAMASRKVPGARESISLLRNAARVSSVCCDVIGDVCGVISGSASAAIAARILAQFTCSLPQVISLLLSAMVAGATVGGKAVGKRYAIRRCTHIVHLVGKLIFYLKKFGR